MAKKILVITAGLHIGGAERVAANISKYAPDDVFEFHYLVFDGYENVYGPEIEERGGKVFSIAPPHKGYMKYFRNLLQLMKEHRYTAVHSHTMFNSGLNMLAAWLSGIPVRISHSHTTQTETPVSCVQKAYEFMMQRLVNGLSTSYFACGVEAGHWLFGKKKFEHHGIVIKNGIQTIHFAWSPESRNRIRMQYGLDEALVIGHTGSLVKVKNQAFLIELMPRILEKRPDAVLMLVGGGNEEESLHLQELAEECKVSEKVIFTGPVHNVNEYLSAFDVFAFPSTREGTPLSLLEAQTNGVPCIVSANVPCDVFLTDLISVVSLSDKGTWIDKICSVKRSFPEKYPAVITRKGYDAYTTYQPIYDTYLKQEQDRCSSISLSFDDGRCDNTWVVDNLLLPRQIPVTLNITTGYIDGTCPEEARPAKILPMEMDDVLRLGKEPLVEIALHGDHHKNTVDDILEARRKLIEWFNLEDSHLFGMASPGSGLSQDQFLSEEYEEVRNKLLYLRTGLRNYSNHFIRTLARKAGRVIHLPLLYRIAYRDTLMRFRDDKIIYSVPIMGDISFEQVRGIIDSAISKKANVTLMFHTISESMDGCDQWAWSWEKFEKLCNYLCKKRENGQLTICTTKDMFQNMN